MRLVQYFQTDPIHFEIPSEYRRSIISYSKAALTAYQNGKYFSEFYNSNHPKSFCFAVGLPRGITFRGDTILLPNPSASITLTISCADARAAAILCNAVMGMVGQTYPLKGNELQIKRAVMLPEKQVRHDSRMLLIHMLAPLCIREHIGEKDRYVTVEDADFCRQFTRVVAYQLRNHPEFSETDKNAVQIIPYEMKKTVVRHYGQKIACSLGTAVLTASPDVLTYLYQSGIGSRRSAGFGLFDIVSLPEEGGLKEWNRAFD